MARCPDFSHSTHRIQCSVCYTASVTKSAGLHTPIATEPIVTMDPVSRLFGLQRHRSVRWSGAASVERSWDEPGFWAVGARRTSTRDVFEWKGGMQSRNIQAETLINWKKFACDLEDEHPTAEAGTSHLTALIKTQNDFPIVSTCALSVALPFISNYDIAKCNFINVLWVQVFSSS
ncbi:hypothetical protein CAPTEDRAFT_217797 [Capitella teleta]|uniref:Uncharacterized protein n=1 Tax=Capitella teleta TaxID=283909 RepID=R7VCU3_CAPTE|nr:hypothetical protein CAPTEDRAFT_217797 [Capitella teleta]|eukprot:ELU16459.1 hypothetical protein CAPTEDRAFT_217797 [Capitella teleta]